MGAFLLPCKLCQVLGCLRGIRSSTLHNIYSANLWKSVSLFPSSATTSLENVWIDDIDVCLWNQELGQAIRENVWIDGVDVRLEFWNTRIEIHACDSGQFFVHQVV